MSLGNNLFNARKKSGLSQEQLAARITVSRQAVSKWELDDAVPDTENIIQLSRIFGVSCDYLLREEVDDPGAALVLQNAPQPAMPEGWAHNAFALPLGLCALGLVGGLMFYRMNGHTARPLAIGFMIQLLGVALFELSAPRMGERRRAARLSFYATACWLVLPIPVLLSLNWGFNLGYWNGTPLQGLICYFSVYQLLSAAVTAALLLLRQRICAKR